MARPFPEKAWLLKDQSFLLILSHGSQRNQLLTRYLLNFTLVRIRQILNLMSYLYQPLLCTCHMLRNICIKIFNNVVTSCRLSKWITLFRYEICDIKLSVQSQIENEIHMSNVIFIWYVEVPYYELNIFKSFYDVLCFSYLLINNRNILLLSKECTLFKYF